MAEEKKKDDITVTIYKEVPGEETNKSVPVEQLKENQKEAAEVSKKLATEKEEAKKDEQTQNDTTGEDG